MTPRFAVSRLLQAMPTVVLVVVATFFMVRLVPGNPGRQVLGPRASAEAVQAVDQKLGLTSSLPSQFGHYVSGLVGGNLGYSVANDRPVSQVISGRITPTLLLVCYSAILAVLLTVPLAMVAAAKPNGVVDQLIGAIPIVGIGLPTFWLSLVFIIIFGVDLHWFPVGGYSSAGIGHLNSLFLPSLTVAISIVPFTIRSLRAALVDVFASDYVASVRARGLPRRSVLVRHALRNALIPVVVVFGLNIGWLIGNTLVVETIFAIPGLGSLLFNSVLSSDYEVVQAATLIIAVVVVGVNVVTDLARAWLDPRVAQA